MHNNYYFLRQLSPALEKIIKGFTLVSCFSQNKDELVLEFNSGEKSFFIKATLLPEFQCLSFPSTFHRARKNSIDLFSEIVMRKVEGIRQFQNERSFALMMGENFSLVFKMHGRHANIILFAGQKSVKIFRHNFTTDANLILDELDRTIHWTFEQFSASQGNLEKSYFTFGKPVWGHLESLHFEKKTPTQRWALVEETIAILKNPVYSIIEGDAGGELTLLPAKNPYKVFSDPVEALNEFFYHYIKKSSFQKEKTTLLSGIHGRIKQSRSFIEKMNWRLKEIQKNHHYQLWADLIMANLSNIRAGAATANVVDFHDAKNIVTIKLRKELSPQKNAEAYYRKSKNQNIEVRTLKETLQRKEKELEGLLQKEEEILSAINGEALRPIAVDFAKKAKEKDNLQTRPYHAHEWNGFHIWVGKNAKTNDELTIRYSYKEDLWLHAKDVAGSHVLVKHQAGKTFPKDVVERAAQLAAYHSKRKNESSCPVSITTAKYVRKRKGDPAGVVIVEKEEVILVEPKK